MRNFYERRIIVLVDPVKFSFSKKTVGRSSAINALILFVLCDLRQQPPTRQPVTSTGNVFSTRWTKYCATGCAVEQASANEKRSSPSLPFLPNISLTLNKNYWLERPLNFDNDGYNDKEYFIKFAGICGINPFITIIGCLSRN